MAKKNDNGLYLPLRVDLDAWEASLADLDAPLLQKMRELRSETSNLTLEYEVKISNAKAAGDNVKALALETEKLNKLEKIQAATVRGLAAAYEKSVKAKGADASATKQLLKNLQQQQIALNNTRMALDNLQGSLGGKLVNALRSASPAFAQFNDVASAAANQIAAIAPASKLSGAALGGLGLAVAGIVAAFSAAKHITSGVRETAEAAANANEEIYQMREELNSSYEEAEKLHGIMTMDGIAGDVFAKTMNKLNKQLMNAGENGNLASDMLTRFNVNMRNGDGTRKTTIEQLRELSEGYKRAAEVGAGRDFLTATSTTPLVHILADLDGYTERWERIRVEQKKDYDQMHLLLEMNNHLAESERQLASAKGEVYTEAAIRNKENEIRANVAEAQIIKDNINTYKDFAETISAVSDEFTRAKLIVSVMWKNFITESKTAIGLINSAGEKIQKLWQFVKPVAQYLPGMPAVIAKLGEAWDKAAAEADKYYQKQSKIASEKPKRPEPEQRDPAAERAAAKAAADAQKKAADAQIKLEKALQSAKKTDYERDIQRISDERDEYIKAGADKAKADELFAIKKAEVDKKYAEKGIDVNKQRAAYEQISTIFMNETQKRLAAIEKEKQAWIQAGVDEVSATQAAQAQIREAKMTEAERTIRENARLIKRAQIEQSKGGDWEARVKNYANDQYMRSLGVNNKDLNWAKQYGFQNINSLANARERVLGGLVGGSTTVNAPININLDNTVVENESAMVNLANKIAKVMLPMVQQAVGAPATSNGY